ncbi:hemerythrin domain-containing protein [Streptomyces zingiberis]|uniref:Hemerythrin domain-containing protein n=1 Tax=Streptomyces zingiberis TaxID=2053010 RepID=A0ABX1BVA2_9ACTN|nr:hemerythrin domain-containing protein [Streptomyces zingiberis]NJQ00371.1 hemerythrin domain-containing protein [Streptomyces zingiberis]
MSERETTRLVAWSQELRRVHARLREALRVTREAVAGGASGEAATRELLLYCHGFCAALDSHHRGEDSTLFPAIAATNPELRPVLRSLEQDHSMIGHLLGGLSEAVGRAAPPEELDRHLDGVAALMENHFRYEERQLLTVLESLELLAEPGEVLGPL